jgi:glycosyltransferase involved in cell wall biosynthesis
MKIVFYVPVFNEIRALPQVLEEFRQAQVPDITLFLVNNGSSDGSEHVVRSSGFRYIDLPKNLGVGYSYIRALEWALAEDFDIFGCMAANGKMLPSEMGRLLLPLLAGQADYVTGSRFLPGGDSPNLPAFRRSTIPMVNRFVRLFLGVRLSDATCGYRALRLEILRHARFNWHAPWLYTYGCEYYLYAKVLLDGQLRWSEVPITMRYPARGVPYSKIRPIRDWYAMLKPWVVARLERTGFERIGLASRNTFPSNRPNTIG